MLKKRQSHNRLIFNMWIPIPGQDSLYTETEHRCMSMDHIDNKSLWDRWHLTTCNYLNQCLLCFVIAYVLHRHQRVGIYCNFTLASHIFHNCEQDDTSLAIYYSTKFHQLIFTMSMSKGLCQMAVMKAVLFKSALMCSDIDIISIS